MTAKQLVIVGVRDATLKLRLECQKCHAVKILQLVVLAVTDLKLVELQDLLRKRPEEDRRDLNAVSEELKKRQKEGRRDDMSDHPADGVTRW
jgi:hypothetical protein